MARSHNVIQTLKRELKSQGITYRQLGKHLELSESAIKQMFATDNFSLKRLDDICDVLGLDITELVDIASSRSAQIEELGLNLERELVADIKLLLVAYCLVNYWRVEEILEKYALSESEIIQLLAKLDKMKLIELLPGNRVKLLIARDFKWRANGPIEKFFRTQVQGEFFKGDFNTDGALRIIKNGDLSPYAQQQLMERLQSIGKLFDDICHEDRKLAASKRQGTTMIVALRNWQFTVFSDLENCS